MKRISPYRQVTVLWLSIGHRQEAKALQYLRSFVLFFNIGWGWRCSSFGIVPAEHMQSLDSIPRSRKMEHSGIYLKPPYFGGRGRRLDFIEFKVSLSNMRPCRENSFFIYYLEVPCYTLKIHTGWDPSSCFWETLSCRRVWKAVYKLLCRLNFLNTWFLRRN